MLSFRESSFHVSKCSKEFTLDIFDSKGLTERNPISVTWNVLSVNALTTSAQKVALNALVNTNFANLKYIKFNETTIASLAGSPVEIKVTVTNFFSQTSNKTIIITFLAEKRIVLEGLYSSYTLFPDVDQNFFVTARIPSCSGDNLTDVLEEERNLIVLCQLYKSNGGTLIKNLTD